MLPLKGKQRLSSITRHITSSLLITVQGITLSPSLRAPNSWVPPSLVLSILFAPGTHCSLARSVPLTQLWPHQPFPPWSPDFRSNLSAQPCGLHGFSFLKPSLTVPLMCLQISIPSKCLQQWFSDFAWAEERGVFLSAYNVFYCPI